MTKQDEDRGGRDEHTPAPVEARKRLRHIDPRDPRVPPLGPLALALPLPRAGHEDELVVGPDGGLGVADDLNHAEPADGACAPRRRGEVGAGLERGEGVGGEPGGDGGARRPEGDEVDVAAQLPGRRDMRVGRGGGGDGGGVGEEGGRHCVVDLWRGVGAETTACSDVVVYGCLGRCWRWM